LHSLSLKCDTCDLEFTEKERLERHKRVHNRKRNKQETETPNYSEYVAYDVYSHQKGP